MFLLKNSYGIIVLGIQHAHTANLTCISPNFSANKIVSYFDYVERTITFVFGSTILHNIIGAYIWELFVGYSCESLSKIK